MFQEHPIGATGFAVDAQALPLEGWENHANGTGTWRTLVCADRNHSDGIVAGLAEFAAGDTLNPHRHRQPEVYFGVAGDGIVTIDGVAHPLRPGVAVYIPSEAEHSVVAGPAGLSFFYSFPTSRFGEIDYRFSGA